MTLDFNSMPLTLDQEQALIVAAQEGVRCAYTEHQSPDDYRIGAAVLTEKGTIFSSGQYRSDSASLTLHAEQCALAHAAAHGEYGIVALAVTWNEKAASKSEGESIYPCHMCKQLLWESHLRSGLDTEVLIVEAGVIIERIYLRDLVGKYTWPK